MSCREGLLTQLYHCLDVGWQTNLEILGSNPAGSWTFIFSCLLLLITLKRLLSSGYNLPQSTNGHVNIKSIWQFNQCKQQRKIGEYSSTEISWEKNPSRHQDLNPRLSNLVHYLLRLSPCGLKAVFVGPQPGRQTSGDIGGRQYAAGDTPNPPRVCTSSCVASKNCMY